MQFLIDLWLPIVLTAVALFVLSSLAWTVLPHHTGDFKEIPDPDAWREALAKQGVTSGSYMYPFTEDRAQMKSDDFKQRYTDGPWCLLTAWPARPNMPRNMLVTLLYFGVVAILIAYVTYEARPLGASFAEVFQVSFTAGALAFLGNGLLNAVWFGKPIRWIITDTADCLAYALAAGVLFAVLWPAAPSAVDPSQVSFTPPQTSLDLERYDYRPDRDSVLPPVPPKP